MPPHMKHYSSHCSQKFRWRPFPWLHLMYILWTGCYSEVACDDELEILIHSISRCDKSVIQICRELELSAVFILFGQKLPLLLHPAHWDRIPVRPIGCQNASSGFLIQFTLQQSIRVHSFHSQSRRLGRERVEYPSYQCSSHHFFVALLDELLLMEEGLHSLGFSRLITAGSVPNHR